MGKVKIFELLTRQRNHWYFGVNLNNNLRYFGLIMSLTLVVLSILSVCLFGLANVIRTVKVHLIIYN